MPSITIAIDTVKAAVAAEAIKAGAAIINDISALAHDPMMAAIVVQHNARIVLMHKPRTGGAAKCKTGRYLCRRPDYQNFIQDVSHDLQISIDQAVASGIARDKIIIDPGVGFGKTVEQNIALIAHLGVFKKLGFPILMGVSRKSFIGHVLDVTVDARLEGTAACVTACVLNGANILRVHDVKFMAPFVKMADAIKHA